MVIWPHYFGPMVRQNIMVGTVWYLRGNEERERKEKEEELEEQKEQGKGGEERGEATDKM